MKTTDKKILWGNVRTLSIALVCFMAAPVAHAASTDLSNVPMAVKNAVTPNLLVTYDNSQSMDAMMAGALIAGNDPTTRGNIGRSVLRNAITAYRTVFNWGLMDYGTYSPQYKNTWVYYIGDDAGMIFTDNCTGYVAGAPGYPPTPGISSDNNRRCIPNPQPFSPGGAYVTFDRSSDDPDFLDALYDTGSYTTLWGLAASKTTGSTNYSMYSTHLASQLNSWASSAFSGSKGTWGFTPTDAGFLASYPTTTRQLYEPRAWGYLSNITGQGAIKEPVQVDSSTHYSTLEALLANETNSSTGGEIKNSALYTPLKGTLDSAEAYFSTSYQGYNSPIAYSCQQNFVMMVTDGKPTGTTTGVLYSTTDRTNTCTTSTSGNCSRDVQTAKGWSYKMDTATNLQTATATWPDNTTATWTFGQAATDAINAVTALRTTPNNFNTALGYDINTYVVALGDTVNNSDALAIMNAMAYAGGTGASLLATDQATFQSAITKVTDSIISQTGSAAAVSISNPHISQTDHTIYTTQYNSGTWTGDLGACPINTTTGANDCPYNAAGTKQLINSTKIWSNGSAQEQLDKRTSADRYIVTSTDTAGVTGGVQFEPTSATTATTLSASQQTLLNTPGASPTDGATVVAYLRGDRSGETTGTYRTRAHLMGDAVHAEPTLVRAPDKFYADTGYMGSTTTFKESQANRTRMIYQGTNDGMLHAFNADTGAEVWAYIPNLVISKLNNLTSITSFSHQYLVDATPTSGDVDFKNCCETGGGNDWRTILVGGLGKGGRGYYALDVTNPLATSEANVASKVLWEFPNSITNTAQRNSAILNTGYTFGKPIIVKTKATGWVVLVTSGYNNGINTGDSGGDGLGHLYVLNPMTGDLIMDIPTPACDSSPTTQPCGLAQISADVATPDTDNTVDYVYGGDLYGNVWRFDLTGSTASKWSVSKFAVLRDPSGATQPITAAPLLVADSSRRYVYVGTGQYLGASDVPCPSSGCTGGVTPNAYATQTETMYGLVDDLVHTLADPLRPVLQKQTVTSTFTTTGNTPARKFSNNSVDYSTQYGWYIDFPDTGERVYSAPTLFHSTISFTTNIPSDTVCIAGGSSWLYELNYLNGGMVDGAPWAAVFLGNKLSSGVVVAQLPSGQGVAITHGADTSSSSQGIYSTASGGGSVNRISWREITQ